jgi:adenine-specific DNA glycosylase
VHDGRTLLYRASKRDCDVCPIRAKCCTTAEARNIPRDLHEDARDIARQKMKTKAFAKSQDERKRVEMRFAHLKIHHGFERMRLRGLSGARDEFHLAAIAQTSKRSRSGPFGRPQSGSAQRSPEPSLQFRTELMAIELLQPDRQHPSWISPSAKGTFFDSIGQERKYAKRRTLRLEPSRRRGKVETHRI